MIDKGLSFTALSLAAVLWLAGCGSVASSGDTESLSERSESYLYDGTGSVSEEPIPADMAYPYNSSAFVLNDVGDMTYTDTASYTYRDGIDVSSYCGDIDWNAVRNAGYEFVFIRIGYRGYESGQICEDEKFEEYYSGAVTAGLDVGVYFFSQAVNESEAAEEADFVRDTLNGRALQLPAAIDIEQADDENVRTDGMSGDEFTANVLAYSSAIRKAGYESLVYTNLYGQTFMLNMHKLDGIPIWFSGFDAVPNTEYTFDYWQYSSTGTVDGIIGNADLDIQMIPAGESTSDNSDTSMVPVEDASEEQTLVGQ